MTDMNQNKKVEDEIKFLDLLKSPIRLFGWVYVYFFLLILILGIFFLNNIIPTSFNEQSVSPPDYANLKLELFEKRGGIIPAVDLLLIKNPTSDIIEKGKTLYDAHCKSCHGDKGLGDGPAGIIMNPKARNFTDVEGWTNGKTVDQIYRTLQEGIISRGMGAYEYLTPADRFNIILYIGTLTQLPPITGQILSSIDKKYNLSAGTLNPNQISAEKALDIFDNEMTISTERLNKAIERLSNENTMKGATVFKLFSKKPELILKQFLSNNKLTFNQFLELLGNAPLLVGFNVSVLRLDSNSLKEIYDYLKIISS